LSPGEGAAAYRATSRDAHFSVAPPLLCRSLAVSWSGLCVAQQLERVLQLRVLVGVWKHVRGGTRFFLLAKGERKLRDVFLLASPHFSHRTRARGRHRARVLSQAFFAVITHPT